MLVLLLVWALPCSAQRFGQWWWEAEASAGARSYENTINDAEAGTYDEQQLRLKLGVNGFILHPAVARFHLGIESLVSRFEGTSQPDSNRLGFEGELKLFPRGRYVWWFYARHAGYDYPDEPVPAGDQLQDSLLTIASLPDTTLSLGARVRIRSGLLRGSTILVERSTVGFLDPTASEQVTQRESYDWTGVGDMGRHVRVERRYNRYGVVDFATTDLTATFDQHGQLSERWRWDLTTFGNQRDLSYPGTDSLDIFQLGVRNRLTYRAEDNSYLQLDAEGGIIKIAESTTHSHDLSAKYVWHTPSGWDLYPFAGYALHSGEGQTSHLPRIGTGVTRTFTGRNTVARVDSILSYAVNRSSGERALPSSSQLGYAVSGSLTHGTEAGFLKQLEVSWNRDEIRQDWQTEPDLPDLGAGLQGGSTQDRQQARLTLSHSWRRLSIHGYSEWQETQSIPDGPLPELLTESLTHTLTVNGKRLTLHLAAGDRRFQQQTGQEISYQSAGLTVRPWGYTSIRAVYRTDTRVLDHGPDIDGELLIAGLSFQIGAFSLDAEASQVTERLATGNERVNRIITWSVRRRFAGWLPIVSAPQRRGTVQ